MKIYYKNYVVVINLSDNMFIQVQETPNPQTMKFLPGVEIITNGNNSIDLINQEEAKKISPLASVIFDIAGVKGVFLGKDFIAVTKLESQDWLSLKTMIITTIMDYITSGQPFVLNQETANDRHLHVSSDQIVQQIIELIETKVKPAVAEDGGDIEFHSYDNGTVYVKLKGACSGCPSSTYTLKSGIQNMLQYYVPEVENVEDVSLSSN